MVFLERILIALATKLLTFIYENIMEHYKFKQELHKENKKLKESLAKLKAANTEMERKLATYDLAKNSW